MFWLNLIKLVQIKHLWVTAEKIILIKLIKSSEFMDVKYNKRLSFSNSVRNLRKTQSVWKFYKEITNLYGQVTVFIIAEFFPKSFTLKSIKF